MNKYQIPAGAILMEDDRVEVTLRECSEEEFASFASLLINASRFLVKVDAQTFSSTILKAIHDRI